MKKKYVFNDISEFKIFLGYNPDKLLTKINFDIIDSEMHDMVFSENVGVHGLSEDNRCSIWKNETEFITVYYKEKEVGEVEILSVK